ncbi:lysine-specific demethylase JMJ705-like [Sesamum indicum]|uniref:Lysine-specific demethylase JMJ705-like n=1 Tax=Sesamum indicum TaxID=4182 RepID=A0A6I9UH11_SESIN|nr:lysine-specific demethylase JMJ705-like [Sesamum indicum]XP_020555151.1 lysine-specific demethylase JMJ705-like [Sesamum indicum]
MMSLDVLLSAGVPWCSSRICCHFPRAYHSGFSPGYYCGDAADMANTESSSVAREAAIHSAAIRCPPMVSRFQLSYDLAVSLCSRFVFFSYV